MLTPIRRYLEAPCFPSKKVKINDLIFSQVRGGRDEAVEN
jgi:hypothetical protein